MGYRGDDDAAKIAAANLLDNYREQWNENFRYNKDVASRIDKHINDLLRGNIVDASKILSTLSESVMITPANRKANMALAEEIKRYIAHIARRRPRPSLTILRFRLIQQKYIDAISAHFVHQSQLVSMVLIQVFTNINIVSKTSLIPRSLRDDMKSFSDDDYFDDDDKYDNFDIDKDK